MSEDKQEYNGYDVDKIYDYKEYPDVRAGKCDNCGHTLFSSSVKDFKFYRKCNKCGMTKII